MQFYTRIRQDVLLASHQLLAVGLSVVNAASFINFALSVQKYALTALNSNPLLLIFCVNTPQYGLFLSIQ